MGNGVVSDERVKDTGKWKIQPFLDFDSGSGSARELCVLRLCRRRQGFSTDDMEGENFIGWLVPTENADTFEQEWSLGTSKLFRSLPAGARFTFAIWEKKSGEITVKFKNF